MTRETPPPYDRSITDRAALQSAIHELLVAASANGVETEGAFELRNGAAYPDWDVVVTELTKDDDAESL